LSRECFFLFAFFQHHRYAGDMKSFAVCLLFLASLLPAQLILPDFFEEDDPFEEERIVPDPERQGGLHAREGAPVREAPAVDAQTRQTIQHIHIGMPNMIRRPGMQPRGNIRSDILAHLLGGPVLLKAQIYGKDGKSSPATLLNQTLLVDTGVATLPIRMHLLAAVEALPEEGHFRFILKDRDEIKGRPAHAAFFRQNEENDLTEIIAVDSFRRLEF